MSNFATVYCPMFLLGQLFFFGGINAQQNELTTTIEDENGIDIELKWILTEQFLANEHLPIYDVTLSQPITRNEKIMERIGPFETYHDLDKSSAVVLTLKRNRLSGFIGTKYLIVNLPLKKLNRKHIIGQSKFIITNPLSKEQTPPSIDAVPSTSKDLSTPSIKKRPLEENQFAVNPDLPSTSHGSSGSSLGKRPRTDNNDISTPKVRPILGDSILRQYLYNSERTPSLNAEAAAERRMLDRYLTEKTRPKNSEQPSDSSNLLRSILEAPTISKPREKEHVGTYFPEVLIFVSYDMIKSLEHLQSGNGYSKDHVLYVISYMNAVSMLFAKLKKDINIHINIAAIVFENEVGAFPFSNPEFVNDQLVAPNGDLVLNSIIKYINSNRDGRLARNYMVTEDAFDFFLFMTPFRDNSQERRFHGISTELFDVMEQRSRLRYLGLNLKLLGAAVDGSNKLKSYVDAAREIAHLLGTSDDYIETNTIMGSNNYGLRDQCSDSLKWGRKSVNSFRNYFSQNKNRCYLLNKPRSLHEYGVPMQTLLPADQCGCYSYETTLEERLTLNPRRNRQICMATLPCLESPPVDASYSGAETLILYLLEDAKNVPLPIDGTPCGTDKVCWRRQCVPVRENVLTIG